MTQRGPFSNDPQFVQARQLLQQGKSAEALAILEAALRSNPRSIPAIQEFAVACDSLGEVNREAAVLSEMAEQAPDVPVLLAYCAQGLMQCARWSESLKRFEQALAITPDDPQIKAGYSMAVLRSGDLARGFQLYESREVLPGLREVIANIPRPRYTRGNLHGKTILVLSEQGMGDSIMFARYIPMLARRGGKIIVVAHPGLMDLLRTVQGVSRVARFDDPFTAVHAFTLMASLPTIFSTTLSTVPHDVPYLKVPAFQRDQWQQRISSDGATGKRIGLVWAGTPTHAHDHYRSVHLADLAPLAEVPGVTFYSLQKGSREDEAAAPPAGMKLVNLSPQIKDMTDVAAALQMMDLLITVDTGPAHLAGALARPVWTMIQYAPDFRWLTDRDDSPWYPTMRLFRQAAMWDWKPVIARMRDELTAWARK